MNFPPSLWETKSHVNKKQQAWLHFCLLIFIFDSYKPKLNAINKDGKTDKELPDCTASLPRQQLHPHPNLAQIGSCGDSATCGDSANKHIRTAPHYTSTLWCILYLKWMKTDVEDEAKVPLHPTFTIKPLTSRNFRATLHIRSNYVLTAAPVHSSAQMHYFSLGLWSGCS